MPDSHKSSALRKKAIKALQPFARLSASLKQEPALQKTGLHIVAIGGASITSDDLHRAADTLKRLEKSEK